MKAKGIFAVPTVVILQYYVDEASTPERKTVEEALAMHPREFKRQMAAGVAFVVGSNVGPFPHGRQARDGANGGVCHAGG